MKQSGFSRREREVMDIAYRRGQHLGRVSAAEVLAEIADPPSYSSVRSTRKILEQKGHLPHQADGNRYFYSPTLKRSQARRSALDQLLSTFFDDSPAAVVTALLEARGAELSEGDLEQLSRLIERAREEGR